MQQNGTVEAIHLADVHSGPPRVVNQAVAHPGHGLVGDRHYDDPEACDISLIEAEAVERARAETGLDLGPADTRRQVLVRGVDLSGLIGRRFRVGEVECEGEERCEPCQHLAGLVGRDVLKGLLHTGLRARVIVGGTIRRGDPVEAITVSAAEQAV